MTQMDEFDYFLMYLSGKSHDKELTVEYLQSSECVDNNGFRYATLDRNHFDYVRIAFFYDEFVRDMNPDTFMVFSDFVKKLKQRVQETQVHGDTYFTITKTGGMKQANECLTLRKSWRAVGVNVAAVMFELLTNKRQILVFPKPLQATFTKRTAYAVMAAAIYLDPQGDGGNLSDQVELVLENRDAWKEHPSMAAAYCSSCQMRLALVGFDAGTSGEEETFLCAPCGRLRNLAPEAALPASMDGSKGLLVLRKALSCMPEGGWECPELGEVRVCSF
jgi:hypothetical protein